MNCDFYKCQNKAAYLLVFEFRAHHNAEPVLHPTDIRACAHCRSIVTPEMLLNDQAFHIASEAIIKSGRLPPERDLTTIQWKTISEP